MLLTEIFVVIILALIYHFVTKKKQISEWKKTRVQPMTAIPEKKTPEEIIKESKELQLKADKKQVGKTKKRTKSKKSKKVIKSIPKGTDISKEKAETDKKIEMAESSRETIKAVAATRNIIPQIVPNVATEEITKAAEKIRREDSEKKKRKLKRKSKSKKGREMEKEMSVKKHMMSTEKSETKLQTEVTPFQLQNTAQYMEEQNIMGKKSKKRSKSKKSMRTVEDTDAKEAESSQMPETDIISPKLTLDNEATAINVGQQNMVPPITEEAVDKALIKDEPQGERKDSKKIKMKSKKRPKSKKSKRSVEHTVAEEAASSQMPETDIISPKLTLDNEATAINEDQLNMVPPITEEAVDKAVIKDEPQGERKDSKKIKKKSKKASKSKKSKRSVEHTVAKETASSQMPETDIISPKLTLDNEATAINVHQMNMVPPIDKAAVENPVIKDEPQGERKDSKKIKKMSKKASKSKKGKRSVEHTVAKETASSHMPETDIISPKITLDNEVTAINVDQLNMVPPKAADAVEIPKIKDEPIGEKKDSKKIKKKSKKRSKSNKSKKTVEDTVAKEAESSQMPETIIISPKLTLDNEATAINVGQQNVVPPITEEAVDKAVIKDEPQGERKDSKKIKKMSKKASKSKKGKRSVEHTGAKETASSHMPETDIISPKLTLDNEATAINVDQLNMVPPIAEAAVEKRVIKDEPKGEKEASKKIKKKSKKRSKSKKSNKPIEDKIAK